MAQPGDESPAQMGVRSGPLGRPDSDERASHDLATEACAALYRAYRAARFYPANHPVAVESLDALSQTFARTLDEIGSLKLTVMPEAFLFGDQAVFGGDGIRDNIAELMFRDGIRSLTFHRGIEHEEVSEFVWTLVRAQEIGREEQDLATILWDCDFAHLDYSVTDPLLEGDDWEGKGQVLERFRADLLDKAAHPEHIDLGTPTATGPGEAGSLDDPANSIIMQEFSSEAISGQLENEPDVLFEFLEVLTEVLVTGSTDEEVGSASKAISDVLSSYLDWGEFGSLTLAVRRLQSISETTPARSTEITGILDGLASPDALRKSIFELDGKLAERRPQLEELLYLLRHAAYPSLVELLAEAGGKTSRKCILNVCTMGEGVPLPLVTAKMNDPRWYVVRNMVFMLGALGDPEAGSHLEGALDHPDERVRREAVRSLSGLGGPRANYLITSSLTDPAPSVRILAARALARLGQPDAAAAILTQITSKDFPGRDDTEVEVFFEALGEVADDRALPFLQDLWGGKTFLRSKPMAIRLGALKAMGRMATPEAMDILARASRAGDEELRRQARRSLLEAERRAANR